MAFLPLSEWSLSKAANFKLVCDKKNALQCKETFETGRLSVLILETRLKTLKSELLKKTSNPKVSRNLGCRKDPNGTFRN